MIFWQSPEIRPRPVSFSNNYAGAKSLSQCCQAVKFTSRLVEFVEAPWRETPLRIFSSSILREFRVLAVLARGSSAGLAKNRPADYHGGPRKLSFQPRLAEAIMA